MYCISFVVQFSLYCEFEFCLILVMSKTDLDYRSFVAYKGHVQRRIRVLESTLEAQLCVDDAPAIDSELARLDDSFVKLEKSYDVVIKTITDDKYEEFENSFGTISDSVDDIRGRALEVKRNLQPIPVVNEIPAPIVRRKIDTALKPERLSIEVTLSEFRAWEQSFKVYYSSNEMGTLPLMEQHGYLTVCLDLKVYQAIQFDISETTPVLDVEGSEECSCLKLLANLFLALTPLVIRRYKFFNCNQKTGERFSSWYLRLQMEAEEAELGQMSVDDLFVMRFITGTCDKLLREEFLRQQEADKASLLTIAKSWERANTVGETLESPSAFKMSTYRASKRVDLPRESRVEKSYVCYGCGRQGSHDRFDCPAKDQCCNTCAGVVHFAVVCGRFGGSRSYSRRARSRSLSPLNQSRSYTERPRSPSPVARTSFIVVNSCLKSANSTPPMRVKLYVDDQRVNPIEVDALPDTGATDCIVSRELANKLALVARKTNVKILTANGGLSLIHI